MTLSVIGAGLPRTGTLSMKTALEQLGFGRCYHMEEVFAEVGRSHAWASFFGGGPVDWDQVFEGYGAAVDAPACFAWRALIEHFPDTKVVLTLRDEDSWYASMRKTILADGYIDALMASPVGPMIRNMLGVMMGIAGPPPPGPPPAGPPSREMLAAMRAAHNAQVLAAVPADRLLVYHVGEGWEPLCRFLGAPVPQTPFPHVNDADTFHQHFPVPA